MIHYRFCEKCEHLMRLEKHYDDSGNPMEEPVFIGVSSVYCKLAESEEVIPSTTGGRDTVLTVPVLYPDSDPPAGCPYIFEQGICAVSMNELEDDSEELCQTTLF